MTFEGFEQKDFETFLIDGLDARMEAVQKRIQPKFKSIGETLCTDLAILAGNEMYLHIAKHARRTVNPPKDTWLAICHDKRGYKKHPHFQIGLFDDHVFIWLAFIYELPNKREIAERFLENLDSIQEGIPSNYVISLDHTQKKATSVKELHGTGLEEALERFRDVKKSEFLVGLHIPSDDAILKDGNEFLGTAKHTFETLMPIYKMAFV
jgi:uncharacterized protein YktB (UPF0637 family)